MVQFTEPERRLIADLRVLLERYDCQLLVEVDCIPHLDGSHHGHHTSIVKGPGIALLIDAELARAVAGEEGPPRR